MEKRSIQVGRSHANPIPSACRIGPFVMSSVIIGTDPKDNFLPDGMDAQCANLFANFRAIAEAAGGTVDDILKMTVWLKDLSDRDELNRLWLDMYPDPSRRPARHALLDVSDSKWLIQCTIDMVIVER